MKKLFLVVLLGLVVGCATDPEFLNCQVEIITADDTLRIDNALVEFEGSPWGLGGSVSWTVNDTTDNVMVTKKSGVWNFREVDIIKMTIIYEAGDE